MGIVITVESIFPPSGTDPGHIAYATQAAQIYVQEICKAFNWETLPWQDQTEQTGTVTRSFNYTTWALVLMIAEGTLPRKYQEFQGLPFGSLTKDERFEWFRHFLDRDENINFYVPVDFDIPKRLYNEFSGETFVVASSVRLAKEMQDLQQEILYYMNKYGADTLVGPNPGLPKSWGTLYEFCKTLEEACNEGIALGLPVQLLY